LVRHSRDGHSSVSAQTKNALCCLTFKVLTYRSELIGSVKVSRLSKACGVTVTTTTLISDQCFESEFGSVN